MYNVESAMRVDVVVDDTMCRYGKIKKTINTRQHVNDVAKRVMNIFII